jgi:hypothetical protein
MSTAYIDSAFDSRLVTQIAAGDARAVGKLFDRYAGLAYNLGHQILQSAERAEQVVFELFLRLWHESDQFNSPDGIKNRLLQNAYVLAKSQLPPSAPVDERWENLTDTELDEALTNPPAPAEALEALKTKLMATIEPDARGGGASPKNIPREGRPNPASSAASGGKSRDEVYAGRSERGRSLWPLLAFGFGIAASILAVYSSFNARKLSFELRDLTIESVAQRQELKIAQAKLGFALAPQTEVLILTGQRAAPKAKAKLVWDPVEGQGILIASGLVPAPADKSYQFWAIAGGKPVAIKTFNVDSTGSAEVKIAHLPPSEHIFAFNVTLELAGGVVEPTGEKLLSGARL